MSRDDLHFRLRIPEGLKARVEAAAKENHRSITAEIVAALEERYPPPKPKIQDILTPELLDRIAAMSDDSDRQELILDINRALRKSGTPAFASMDGTTLRLVVSLGDLPSDAHNGDP